MQPQTTTMQLPVRCKLASRLQRAATRIADSDLQAAAGQTRSSQSRRSLVVVVVVVFRSHELAQSLGLACWHMIHNRFGGREEPVHGLSSSSSCASDGSLWSRFVGPPEIPLNSERLTLIWSIHKVYTWKPFNLSNKFPVVQLQMHRFYGSSSSSNNNKSWPDAWLTPNKPSLSKGHGKASSRSLFGSMTMQPVVGDD